ncbi:hypothetical protein [Sterolibacterium denitrificans]|uniref:hypothetical protein n=1 Tax=Sterolibacterium denitrificans TaxID=157592 RepID=UPI00128F6218|nr:hypothetical protein [Sterolibacterium denitrificans]
MKFYDPYDIWSVPALGELKSKWTRGQKGSALLIPLIGLLEVLVPNLLRKGLRVQPHTFAHVEAMRYQLGDLSPSEALQVFRVSRVCGSAWGLPFSWFSKNGVYSANTPYITNTPYVMEALISIAGQPEYQAESEQLFEQTWRFLESLEVMYSTHSELALSYAPIHEPRKVNNANSYAAFAYALHAEHGNDKNKNIASARAGRLVAWLIAQQQVDGSWFYYADNEGGNFIDCFHSCFVIKNLIKVKKLLPGLAESIQPTVDKGWSYIHDYLYDSQYGLCRRFSQRSHHDPFRWDLYDQAEYLGLLVDFSLYDEAQQFIQRVEDRFFKNGHWYCRIDILGRRWGKNFLRWGIAPYLYHKHRLKQLHTGAN